MSIDILNFYSKFKKIQLQFNVRYVYISYKKFEIFTWNSKIAIH